MRYGHAPKVTLGGRRVGVDRPRARTADAQREAPLATYARFADRDPLTRVVLEQMLAGVSTRRFARTREPVGQDIVDAERSVSKSAVSREFVGRTGEHLRALMLRPLGDRQDAAAPRVSYYASEDIAGLNIVVLNITTGRREEYLQDIDVFTHPAVPSLVLRPSGSAAWMLTMTRIGSSVVTKREVCRTASNGDALLDSGAGIAPSSLRLSGKTLSWTNAGVFKTATLN